MSRWERFGTRDLTYSKWHREQLEDAITYIDIDAAEYCQRCRRPLALIELARDVGQSHKTVTVIRNLARLAGIAAYLVLYKLDGNGEIERFRVTTIEPRRGAESVMAPADFANLLRALRVSHDCREAVAS